jgi:exonuclease III
MSGGRKYFAYPLLQFHTFFPMTNTNNWNIMDWNIRGINSQDRWNDIRQRFDETNCNIICLQETKRENFDQAYLRNFCPKNLNQFAYTPSVGNSGGIITVWNGNLFNGILISQDRHHITMKFTCKYSGRIWYLTNIYGPAHNEERMDFITWMADLDSSDMQLWMIMGDFNLIRGPENRSRTGGDNNNMMNFNAIIQAHDLEEIPLKGREFTWSNMQDSPLLERLD